MDGPGVGVPEGPTDFHFSIIFQTKYEVHPPYCSMGTVLLSPGKVARV